jgi:predicted O-methyltransferase YrrM
MKVFKSKEEMLEWCSRSRVESNAIAIEFGVYSGYSISIIRNNYIGKVFGFDSFKGLPEFWRKGYDKGHFKTKSIPNIDGVEMVVGLFQDTLKDFLLNNKSKINLVHFDADLYSSTIFCLDAIKDSLSNNCIFIFDEYHNYPSWEDHEYKAFNEWLSNNKGFCVARIAEVENDEQVAFEVTISI